MENLARKIELYRISITNKSDHEDYTDYVFLDNLLKSFFNTHIFTDENNIHFNIKGNRRYWIKDVSLTGDSLKIILDYAVYNKKLDIIDVDNKQKVNQKGFRHGDQEKQHLMVKIFPDKNVAILVFEKIHNAVTISSIKDIIKAQLPIYLNTNFKDKVQLNSIMFNIDPIASSDFLEQVAELNGISILKSIVYKEKLKNATDEDLIFSGIHSRDEAELIFKSNFREKLLPQDVVKYCKSFITDGKIKDERILRIIIEGNNDNGKLRLDTEGMKLCENIKAKLDIDHTVDSEYILNEFENIINDKSACLPDFLNATISDSRSEAALDLE